MTVELIQMLTRDNQRMRRAGCALAEASMRVVREADGLHRLSLAVADWARAIADEGDRPHAIAIEARQGGNAEGGSMRSTKARPKASPIPPPETSNA
jgi:hypothetical protein